MKLLNRTEFLQMPSGTVYSYYEPCIFTELNIKTSESKDYQNDFVYFRLIGQFDIPVGRGYTEICKKLESHESIPASFEETMREGLFNDKQLFLVYEKEDVERMIQALQDTLKVV